LVVIGYHVQQLTGMCLAKSVPPINRP